MTFEGAALEAASTSFSCGARRFIRMAPDTDLYVILPAPAARHEDVVRSIVSPLAGEIRADPRMRSLFFGRYSDPRPEVRFRVAGEAEWIRGPFRSRVREVTAPHVDSQLLEGVELGSYAREVERYGGEEGMALAEEFHTIDSLACLDLIEIDARGDLGRSRREVSLLMVESVLALLGFDRAQRLACYAHGYQWALDFGHWSAPEIGVLEEKWQALKGGIRALLSDGMREPAAAWGGEEAATVARRCLSGLAPVLDRVREAHAAGRIRQDLTQLASIYTHLHSNRFGVSATPEAILRFFMRRYHEEPGEDGA